MAASVLGLRGLLRGVVQSEGKRYQRRHGATGMREEPQICSIIRVDVTG